MGKATIHDKYTPNWCLIVVIEYNINKMKFSIHFDLITNTAHMMKMTNPIYLSN